MNKITKALTDLDKAVKESNSSVASIKVTITFKKPKPIKAEEQKAK